MDTLHIVTTISRTLGIPSNCSVCNEEYYGLDKCIPKGVCPKCSSKNNAVQSEKQNKLDRDMEIRNYLKNHKWVIKEPTNEK